MHFFTSLTALLFTTLAFGAVIETRDNADNLNPEEDVQNLTCSPKGGACGEVGLGGCCPGLQCYIPPKSGWEPAGPWNNNQGACI
jgi:hypothetical protein